MWKTAAEKIRDAERIFQEALKADREVIELMNDYYGEESHSALDTPEKRAAWMVGFITSECGGAFHIGPSGEWFEKWMVELGYFRCMGSMVPKHHCKKCNYEWLKLVEHPVKCPNCQSRKWS